MSASGSFTRNELLAEKARRESLSQNTSALESVENSFTREALLAEKARRESLKASTAPESTSESFSWPRFIMEQVGIGALSLPDLIHAIGSGAASPKPKGTPARGIQDTIFKMANFGNPDAKGYPDADSVTPSRSPSEFLIPQTQIPYTPAQRIAGHAAKGAGALAIPIGGLSGLARNVGFGTVGGATSGTLQEAGVPPLAADLISLPITVGTLGAAKSLIRGQGNLSEAEKKVADYLKEKLGEKQSNEAAKAIESKKSYPITKYEPMTAEVSGTQLFPQLHRLRYEVAGSGLPERAATQREALGSALASQTEKSISSDEIKTGLKKVLEARKKIRREETTPLYEAVEEFKNPINPVNTKEFLKNTVARGDVEKDLNYVKNIIKPRADLSPTDKSYQEMFKKLSIKSRNALETPKGLYPEGRELAAADKAINSRIRKYERSGESQRKLIMSKAKEAIEKDLESIPVYKQASSKYRELSKPVSEITEHKALSSAMKSNVNNVMDKLYNEASVDNLRAVRGAFKENPNLWEGVRQSSIEHLEKSISNAGSEGRHAVLSYPKLKRFLEKHHKALGEVLDENQLKFLEELKGALHGQNIAKTAGMGVGSPTHSRLATELGVKQGLGIKSAETLSHYIPGGKPLRYFLNRYMGHRDADIMKVLDSALIDPEIAHKLLTSEFHSQKNFNDYLTRVVIPTLKSASEHEKRETIED